MVKKSILNGACEKGLWRLAATPGACDTATQPIASSVREQLRPKYHAPTLWGMAETKDVGDVGRGILEGLFEALADKHSQLDINLQGLSVRLPSTQLSVELNGLVTLTVHMRDLTEDEKKASAARNVTVMSRTA